MIFMEKIIHIPQGVNAEIKDLVVKVKGKKGELEKSFQNPLYNSLVKINKEGSAVKVTTLSDKRKIKSIVGTIAANISKMVKGVTEGYVYKLKIVYLHFPMTVKVAGNEVVITNFLGGKSPKKAKILSNCKVDVKGDEITIEGIDCENAGQTAANIERATKISAKDRRIFQDGCFITFKGG